MQSNGYQFKVLSDHVAEEDKFTHKTHEHTCTTLFKLINDQSEGITIGLEGGWGSGKSTSLNLLQKKIKEDGNNKTLFFIFDAWSHQGDPLRRIFLEKLIKKIDREIASKELRDLLEKISGRTKTVSIKSHKKTTKLGMYISISALLVPLGAALVSGIDFDNQYNWLPTLAANKAAPIYLGALLSLAPAIVSIYWALWGERNSAGDVVWDFFESSSTENYTQDITEDTEKTSIEFEDLFRDITTFALNNLGYEKLVIVIDNLDRVDQQDAKTIWSTLQTFFHHRSYRTDTEENSNLRKIWFIVPHSREGLSSIWESEKSTTINTDSFLDKCFQIRVEVPPPVTSGWINYFDLCADESLTGWPTEELSIVKDSYLAFGNTTSPSPRKIRAIINQIGINGMRWGGVMSTRAICLYSLLRLENSEHLVKETLLKKNIPSIANQQNRDETLKELAGIFFGVQKEYGMELLLGPEIRSALLHENSAYLKSLAEAHSKAFWSTWTSIKGENIPSSAHTIDYIISFTIVLRNSLFQFSEKIETDVLILANTWKESKENLNLDNPRLTEALKCITELQTESEDAKRWLFEIVTNQIEKAVSAQSRREGNIKVLKSLIDMASTYGWSQKRTIYKSLTASSWSTWLTDCSRENCNFDFITPSLKVIAEISNTAFHASSQIDIPAIEVLAKTAQINSASVEWKNVAIKLSEHFKDPHRKTNIDAAYELANQLISRCGANDVASLRTLAETEEFWKLTRSDSLDIVPAKYILASIVFRKSLQEKDFVDSGIREFWASELDAEAEIDSLYDELDNYRALWMLWITSTDPKNKLAIQIIKTCKKKTLYSYAAAGMYLDELSWAEPEEIAEIVRNACIFTGVGAALEQYKKLPITYEKCMHLICLHAPQETREKIHAIIKDIPSETWIEAFDKCSQLFECIDTVDHKFRDAMETHSLKAIREADNNENFWSKYDLLVSKTIDQKLLLKKICDEYFKLEDDILGAIGFQAISKHISPFVKDIDSTNCMKRAIYWLSKDQWDRLQWLSELGFEIEGTPLETLTSRVAEALNAFSDDLNKKDILNRLSHLFKLPPNDTPNTH